MDWRCGSSGRATALQVHSPEFKTPAPIKKKKKLKKPKLSLEPCVVAHICNSIKDAYRIINEN
jgi:hypothetical protein